MGCIKGVVRNIGENIIIKFNIILMNSRSI